METITHPEIAALLGMSSESLRSKNRQNRLSLPPPVGKDRYYLLYDRGAVITWLEHYRKTEQQTSPGLDNNLAVQFLTRSRHGIFKGFSQPCKS